MISSISPGLAAELYECQEESEDGLWKFIAIQDIEHGRWRSRHWLVIQHLPSQELYGIFYEEGLTENCDSSYPWVKGFWDTATPADVTLVPMRAVPVATVRYESIK